MLMMPPDPITLRLLEQEAAKTERLLAAFPSPTIPEHSLQMLKALSNSPQAKMLAAAAEHFEAMTSAPTVEIHQFKEEVL
jgi:hypothetical protein